ncbi:hypothetical protein [Paenibacillus protaetiae]|uniref:Uncharacterized protein n=1 Tax=Paenibacillus protaetiae TaxID=2509456 RepID=A0A4P6EZE5_9BACL|nr:hypothetical protein [Paenibacillus protaetiae]QAY67189.1 hypothetical protein ET464_13050 [Paenibacillus protaetiae]
MRSEDQVKRKLFELNGQLEALKARLPEPERSSHIQVVRLEDMILMLEWVLNAPAGSYHQ